MFFPLDSLIPSTETTAADSALALLVVLKTAATGTTTKPEAAHSSGTTRQTVLVQNCMSQGTAVIFFTSWV